MRSHNEGSIIRRRAAGKFVAKVTMRDGSRPSLACPHKHTEAEMAPRARECDEARANLAQLLRLRDQDAPVDAHLLTVGRYLHGWLRDVRPRIAPATWKKHESIVRTGLIPGLGHLRLSSLGVGDVRRYLAGRPSVRDGEEMLGGQSLRHHRATLRRALADAVRDGLISRNVAALAEAPKVDVEERSVLTADQARLIVEGTKGDRLHALYVLALTTGLRESELLGLSWDDFDGKALHVRNTLHRCDGDCAAHKCLKKRSTDARGWQLREPKTKKSRRSVPLAPLAITALEAHKLAQAQEQAAEGKMGRRGLMFTSPTGWPLHGSNLLPEWYAHLRRLGLPEVTLHDARHSAATILYAAGVPLPVISDLLGHSTIRVTADLYRHRVPELSLEAARRMQEAIG